MTVIVGALCENRSCAVVAADRLETYGAAAAFEGETDTSKIVQVSDGVLVGCSYSDQVGREVLARIRATLTGDKRDVKEIAEVVRQYYDAASSEHRERRLWKMFGVGYPGFREMVVQAQNSPMLSAIAMDLVAPVTKFPVLVIGAAGGEMCLLQVTHDGLGSFDARGTLGIGSGGDCATISLMHRKYSKSLSLPEAIYCVYEAKRTAEIAQGVGTATDIVIVRIGKPAHWMTADGISKLERIFEAKRPRLLESSEAAEILACVNAPKPTGSEVDPAVSPAASP
jgi:hypothetical protein